MVISPTIKFTRCRYFCIDQQFHFYSFGFLLRMFYTCQYVLNCVNRTLEYLNLILAYDHVIMIVEDFTIISINLIKFHYPYLDQQSNFYNFIFLLHMF